MPIDSKKLIEALNCACKFHSYSLTGGRIVEKQLAFCGDSREISEDAAVAKLEGFVKAQRMMLTQAEGALREIRKAAFEEAKSALAESGD